VARAVPDKKIVANWMLGEVSAAANNAGIEVDVDRFHAFEGFEFLAHGGNAVSAGHAGHVHDGGYGAHGLLLIFGVPMVPILPD
jgi:hypothetical protein